MPGRWRKGQSGNPTGRPPNEIRHISLEVLLEEAADRLKLTNPDGTPLKKTTSEVRLERLYHSAIDGDLRAAHIMIKLWKRFLPKYFAPPVPNDVDIIELELGQDIINSWHSAGYFPKGTPPLIEDIDEDALNEAYQASLQEYDDN